MTDYTKTTDFTSKDSLPSGDSGKIIRGAEFGTEFDNIETAVNSKSNTENPAFTGNITVTGTVDGRDIAADGTKLDTIETSADVTDTANVTAAGAVMDSELTNIAAVKALNQGVATTDSPTFAAVTSTGNVTVGGTVDGRDVAADGTKLDTVETNADVTDTANVTAAGALMDSEVTNLDQVKAFDSADYATAAQGTTADNALPKTGGAMTGAITTNSTFDGRDVATDGTKLDGIEASADVTDTANVTAAGALMDSELTSEASVKALNQGVATTDSPTFAGVTANGTVEFDGLSGTGAVTVTDILDQDDMSGNSATALATQQSIKAYVDSQVGTVDTLAEVLANGNATGGTDIAFGDNDKAVFGAGSDLQIYHDGSNSYIDETATGHLFIRSNGDGIYLRSSTNEEIAHFNVNGSVKAYYDNSLKLATTSTGIDVTGNVLGDTFQVDAGGHIEFNFNGVSEHFTSGTNPHIFAGEGSTGTYLAGTLNFQSRPSFGRDINFITGTTPAKRLTVGSTGDISFYEDTGTTAKLFWDASAEKLELSNLKLYSDNVRNEGGILYIGTSGNNATQFYNNDANTLHISGAGNVGIGTSLPQKPLHINSGTGNIGVRVESSDATASIEFMDNGTTSTALSPRVGGISDDFFVQTNGTEAMRIDSSGNVGIGTSSLTGGNTILNLSRTGSGAGCNMQFANSHNSAFYVGLAGNTTGDAILHSADGTAGMAFGTGNTERMRIDSSGSLLHGTTSSSIYNATTGDGVNIKGQQGQIIIAKNATSTADPALWLNNTGVDGAIATFAKDGTTVGSIGTDTSRFKVKSNSLALYLENESNKQLVWGNVSGVPYFYPQSDNDTNIGYPTQRFKDLYLSGAVKGGNGSASAPTFSFGNTTTMGMYRGANHQLAFSTNSTEAMRIDGNGNLLVSKSSTSIGTVGVEAKADGQLWATRDGNPVLSLNRKTSDGSIAAFYKDGVTVGSIACNSDTNNSYMIIGKGAVGLQFARDADADNIMPARPDNQSLRDNAIDLGSSSFRFDDIYATNGTIQTSDRNEKQDIEALSDAEQRVAVACKSLLRKFRWKSSVEENGDDARIHFGIVAQDLQDAFTAEGLDAGRYAMFISTTWTDEETNEERTRMGVRYSELLAFIIAAI